MMIMMNDDDDDDVYDDDDGDDDDDAKYERGWTNMLKYMEEDNGSHLFPQ